MKINLLDTKEQFEKLKKGDILLVKWSDYYTRRTEKVEEIMYYKVAKIQGTEIICNKKYNHYFNYIYYLKGYSNALEVYKITANN